MNPMTLKMVSLPLDYKTNGKGKPIKSGKGNGDFLSTMQGVMNSTQKKSSHRAAKIPGAGLPLKKGYHFYLESLRKRLLGKGKPLNQISLNNKDIPVIKKLLYQCGFSQEAAENLLKELVQNNPSKEIKLSQFFNKIAESFPPKKQLSQHITLEPSAIPYLESALRYFGLTPKELGYTFEHAKLEGGDVDLNRFIPALKEAGSKTKGGAHEIIDRYPAQQIAKNLKEAGLQIPHKKNGGQISIQDLITALEKITGGSDKENHLPPDVKATIEQIVERAVINQEKDKAMSSIQSFSKPGLPNQSSKAKTDDNGNLFDKERLLSAFKEDGTMNEKDLDQKVASPFPEGKVRLISHIDAGKRLETGNKEEKNMVKPQTKVMAVDQDMKPSAFSDTINNVKQHQESSRSFLPTYVIDQVGRKISRSLLRGERAIRLQLKPPELGALKVEMDMKDNILKIGIITENSSVKELLLSGAHELREALVEQGVRLERLDIQIDYDSNQSMASSHEGQRRKQGPAEKPTTNGNDDSEDPLAKPIVMLEDAYLLNVIA